MTTRQSGYILFKADVSVQVMRRRHLLRDNLHPSLARDFRILQAYRQRVLLIVAFRGIYAHSRI